MSMEFKLLILFGFPIISIASICIGIGLLLSVGAGFIIFGICLACITPVVYRYSKIIIEDD